MQPAVTQKHGSGCAVACVAYLLKISYEKALQLFDQPHQAWGRGFYLKEITEALKKMDHRYSYCKLTHSKIFLLKIPGVIVFIARSQKLPLGHYLVRTKTNRWMNPWINFPCIASAKSGFQKRLPGKAKFIIHPESSVDS